MDKVKNKVQRMPRRLKLLSALLACVLVCTLVGVGLAAGEVSINENSSVMICKDQIEVSTKAIDIDDDLSTSTDWGVWTYAGDKITGVMMGYSDGDRRPARQTEITFTNKTNSAVNFSFDWVGSYTGHQGSNGWINDGNAVVKSTQGGEPANGNFKSMLQPGASTSLLVGVAALEQNVSDKDAPTETVTLTNFQAKSADGETITLKSPVNGSYTVTSGENSQVMNAGSSDTPFTYKAADGITVTATADDDYKFALLRDGDDPLTTKDDGTTKVYPSGDTLSALFVKDTEEAPFHIDDSDYYYWEDAMRAAMRHNTKTVVMDIENDGRTYLLPTTVENHGVADMKYVKDESGAAVYTIPNGVTLVVPYKMDVYTQENYGGGYSTGTKDAMSAGGNITDLNDNEKQYAVEGESSKTTSKKWTSKYGTIKGTTGTAYATLVVPEGVTLNVNGTLNVNAVQGSDQSGVKYNSRIVGDYGKMVVGGTVNVNGTLYARGYVVDEHHTSADHIGKINVYSGGTLVQMMQITDWRGGTYGLNAGKGSNGISVMPISTYYLQNNMVPTTYHPGSGMRAQAAITGSGAYVQAPVTVISNGGKDNQSVFVMGDNACVETDYNYDADQLNVTLTGDTAMNCLKLTVGTYSMDTSDKELAVSDNMQITVASGTLTVSGQLKFLPGSKLAVEENADLNIDKDGKVFFYAEADYKDEYTYSEGTLREKLQATGIVKDTNPVQPTGDATLELKGDLTIDGVLAQSTNHPGLVPASAAATVTVNKTQAQRALMLYEPDQKREQAGDTYTGKLPDGAVLIDSFQDSGATKTFIYAIRNMNWTAPKGVMADTAGNTKEFAKGNVYKATEDLKWYSHKLTYNYTDSCSQAHEQQVYYISTDDMTLAAPENHVITGISMGDSINIGYANGDGNDGNKLADGWKSVKFSGIKAQDATINVTLKPYDHVVKWRSAIGTTVSMINYSYLASGENSAMLTYDDKLNITESSISIKDADNKNVIDGAKAEVGTTEDGRTTVTVTGISKDATVTVPYTGDPAVTWKVTDPDGSVTTETVKLESGVTSATYTPPVAKDGWNIVTDATCAEQVVTLTTSKESVEVSNVQGPVTVEIRLENYAHKLITNITTVDEDGEPGTVAKTDYVNDASWTYPAKDKWLVSQYSVTGGKVTTDGQDIGLKQDVATITGDVQVDLTDKTTKIQLKAQAYYFCYTWNAVKTTEDGTATVDELSYKEYVTTVHRVEEDEYRTEYSYYTTLRSNETTGEYQYDSSLEEGTMTFTIPDNICYANAKVEWPGTVKNVVKNTAEEIDKIEDETIKVSVVPYAYNVEIVDAADDSRLELICADAEGNDVTTNEPVAYKGWNDYWVGHENEFISAYTVTGHAKINGSSEKNMETTAIGDYRGSSGLVVTEIKSNVTVSVTFTKYLYYFAWTINGLAESPIQYTEFVKEDLTGAAPQGMETHTWERSGRLYLADYTAPDGYFILKTSRGESAKIQANRRQGTTAGNSGSGSLEVTFAPYTACLKWTFDNEDSYTFFTGGSALYQDPTKTDFSMVADTQYNPEKQTWTYTAPTGRFIAKDGVKVSGCSATIAEDNKSVTVKNLTMESAVSIQTTGPATTYYMGDMSFEYVRNTAVYTWDGKTDGKGAWKPVDSCVWRPSAGSKSFTDALTGQTYTVANGSILLVNGGSEAKTYTITLDGAVVGGDVKMFAKDVDLNSNAATISVPAGKSVVVPITLKYAPNENDKSADSIGTIKVSD